MSINNFGNSNKNYINKNAELNYLSETSQFSDKMNNEYSSTSSTFNPHINYDIFKGHKNSELSATSPMNNDMMYGGYNNDFSATSPINAKMYNNVNYSATSSNYLKNTGSDLSDTSLTNNLIGGLTNLNTHQLNDNLDKNSKLLIDACKNNNYNVVDLMLNNNLIEDYGNLYDGKTVLHYVVDKYEHLKNSDEILNKILSSSNINDFINKKDSYGNTAAILSVKNNNMNLTNKLINFGANKSVKNDDGYYINSESEHQNSTNKIHSNKDIQNIMSLFGLNSNEINSETEQLSSLNLNTTPQYENMYGGGDNSAEIPEDTDQIVNYLINKHYQQGGERNSESENTDFIIDNLEQKYNINSNTHNEDSVNTENLINELIHNYSQSGGSKNKNKNKTIKGSRTLVMYNEHDNYNVESVSSSPHHYVYGGVSDSIDSQHNVSHSLKRYEEELMRLVDNQSTEIFQRIVEKIIKLLNVDEKTARYYKTVLIHKIKKDSPNITQLDLANQVEKNTTKEHLKTINIKDEIEIIEQKRSEREEHRLSSVSDKKPKKKSNKKPNKKDISENKNTLTKEKSKGKSGKKSKKEKVTEESVYLSETSNDSSLF
jgi:hypothetical protein